MAGCDNLIGGFRDNVPKGRMFFKVDCRNLSALSEKSEEQKSYTILPVQHMKAFSF